METKKRQTFWKWENIASIPRYIYTNLLFIVIVIATSILPTSAMLLGYIFLNDCPAQKNIPIYLIVLGSLMLIAELGSLIFSILDRRKPSTKGRFYAISWSILIGWFIVGTVLIYGLTGEWSSDPTAYNYCHPTIYYFMFYLITGTYIVIGGWFLFVIACIASYVYHFDPEDD